MFKPVIAMFSKLTKFLAVCVIAFCFTGAVNFANALSFGSVIVKSTMGQPLHAEVNVRGTKSEIRNVIVKLAHGDDYEKLGVDYKYFLRYVKGEYVPPNDKSKRAYYKFTTNEPFYEPQARILLEGVWPEGRFIKALTLIINTGEDIHGLARSLSSGNAKNLPGQVTVIREDMPYQASPLDDGPFSFNNLQPVRKKNKKVRRYRKAKTSVPKTSYSNDQINAKKKELNKLSKEIDELKVLLESKSQKQ